ncbi:MAG: hypothetical protein ABR968_12235 [Bacteroidales bacterium]|jgi:hypothetical protein
MPGTTIIPRTIKAFNSFITKTNNYLVLGTPTNAVRFNWTAANLTTWQGFLSSWTPLFLLYDNRKESYTTAIKNKLLAIIGNAVTYAQTNKLIELVRACASLNGDDCAVFGLPAKLAIISTSTHATASLAKTKGKEKTVIALESIYPKIIPIGGGILHIKAYLEKAQSGRPHKPSGFDELEYAIGVFFSTATGLPISPEDARLTKEYSTKANFKLPTLALTANLTAIASGAATPLKVAVLFFRWAKSKHPDLDGPWSVAFTTPVM